MMDQLIHQLSHLVAEMREDREERKRGGFRCHADLATKHDIDKLEKIIMSAISEYVGRVTTAFEEIGTNVDGVLESINGVQKDVTDLKAIIEKLQTNAGPISPEDQALLDSLEVKVAALVAKTGNAKDAIAALDAQTETPPTPPTT